MSTRLAISIAMMTAVFIGACDWMPGKPTEADKPVIEHGLELPHAMDRPLLRLPWRSRPVDGVRLDR